MPAAVPPSQLALSYLGMDRNTINESDPQLQQLLSSGWLNWGSNAQGDKTLSPGGPLQDAVDAQYAQIKPGSDMVVMPGSTPLGVEPMQLAPSAKYSANQGGPIMDAYGRYIGSALSTGNVKSINPGLSGTQVGGIDPVTGMERIQITGAHPQVQMGSTFDALLYNIAPLLMTLPISGPLAASMGPLFASLFKFAGSEVTGQGSGGIPVNPILQLLQGAFNQQG